MTTFLLWFFAGIGFTVTSVTSFLILAWIFIKIIAKAEIKRQSRVARLTQPRTEI